MCTTMLYLELLLRVLNLLLVSRLWGQGVPCRQHLCALASLCLAGSTVDVFLFICPLSASAHDPSALPQTTSGL